MKMRQRTSFTHLAIPWMKNMPVPQWNVIGWFCCTGITSQIAMILGPVWSYLLTHLILLCHIRVFGGWVVANIAGELGVMSHLEWFNDYWLAPLYLVAVFRWLQCGCKTLISTMSGWLKRIMKLMKEDTRRFTRWVELTDFTSVDQAWWFWVHCCVCLQYVLLFHISKVEFIVKIFIIMMESHFKVVHSVQFFISLYAIIIPTKCTL